MTRQNIHGVMLAVVTVASASAVHAQQTVGPRSAMTGTIEFMGAEIPLGAVVRGAPFSGEGVTTVSQTLGDGTRIERRVTAKVYRDSEGRIRREQTVLGLDALKPSAEGQPIVTITDPVAGTTYVLDANTRTARRSHVMVWRASESGATGLNTLRATAGIRVERLDDIPPPPPPPPPPPGEPAAGVEGRGARGRGALPNWPEPLGTRQIEGVTVNGTRRTETIPVGTIGNDRPITITDERWESPDLRVLVSSQHHDPRTGDVEYRLTNISRAEPPAHLFTIPADYEVVDAPPPPPPPPAPRQ
jgi:hypothetical protein